MPRPSTGSPRWSPRQHCWIARVSMPGKGEREPVPMPGIPRCELPGSRPATCACGACARARDLAKVISDRARAGGHVIVGTGETMNEWSKRWLKEREARGLTSVDDDRSRLSKHVLPRLGTTAMRAVTRAQIEDLVEELDRKVRDGALSWKTARHVWTIVTRMFADARSSKRRDLRVERADNPTTDVRAPDKGVVKAKQFLYPAELLKLVTCERVPIRWRRIFALAVYTYTRASELQALLWEDVDLDRGVIHVHRAMNRRRKKANQQATKATKTGDARRFPIEPNLYPLLVAMHREVDGKGSVVPAMPSKGEWSKNLKQYLGWAGVKRAELFANDETRKAITFHDMRATGTTWMAVAGVEPLKIKQRAGHRSFDTTEQYIRVAESLHEAFGEPFPALPLCALGVPTGSENGPEQLGGNRPIGRAPWLPKPKTSEILWADRDSKPLRERRETSPRDYQSIGKMAAGPLGDVAKHETVQPNSRPPDPERAELTLDALRRKLDAAIDAEEWTAVAVIRERIRDAERAAGPNVVALPTRRHGPR